MGAAASRASADAGSVPADGNFAERLKEASHESSKWPWFLNFARSNLNNPGTFDEFAQEVAGWFSHFTMPRIKDFGFLGKILVAIVFGNSTYLRWSSNNGILG